MLGKTISHYRIIEKLGGGGMGEVFLAQDTSLDRKVALKFLPRFLQEDPTAKKRFLREAKSAAALDHPFICKIYEVGQAEGKDFISMEYVQGDTLKDKLAEGPLTLKEALEKAVEIAEALEAAHKHDIVHRDLKPSNIMLTPEGHVKVMDFGLAKRLIPVEGLDSQEETLSATLTKTGATLGTLAYMSPEQLRGQDVDTRSDIFSFGVVLYEMLTGVHPFRKSLAMDTADSILHESPPFLTRYTDDVPELLQHTVRKMLAKERDQRYQLVHDVLTNLNHLFAPSAQPPLPAVAGGRRWGRVALMLMAVILVAALSWWALRERRPVVVPGEITSIAVLPLKNLMNDPEQEYFVDGMTETMLTELSKLGSLRVISHQSVMQYKGTDKSLPDIARDLDVDALVEGSVLRAGDTVRITAQLIATTPERHLWADSYDREMRDVLLLHSDVARAVAKAIKIALSPEEEARLARTRPVNPAALDASFMGFYWTFKHTRDGIRKGIEYFQTAIQEDPSYAPAYAGMALAQAIRAFERFDPPREAMPVAQEAVAKALELDETLAEAHAILGFIKLVYEWDLPGAETELKLAIKLNPSSAIAHRVNSHGLSLLGHNEEAMAEARRTAELAPITLGIVTIGLRYWDRGDYARAIEQFQKILETDENDVFANQFVAWAYEQEGLFENALEAWQRVLTVRGELTEKASLAWWSAYEASGWKGAIKWRLENLEERSKQADLNPMRMARLYARLGEKDRTLEWLERSYRERHGELIFDVRLAPWYDFLGDDPRFQDLLRRMGLEP